MMNRSISKSRIDPGGRRTQIFEPRVKIQIVILMNKDHKYII